MSIQDNLLAASNLILSQKQEILNNNPARFSITSNQQGTMQMRDELLTGVGAQKLETRGYQASDLEDMGEDL